MKTCADSFAEPSESAGLPRTRSLRDSRVLTTRTSTVWLSLGQDFAFTCVYWTEHTVSQSNILKGKSPHSKSMRWHPNAQRDGVRNAVFARWVGREGGALVNGISALVKEAREGGAVLWPRVRTCLQPGSGPFPATLAPCSQTARLLNSGNWTFIVYKLPHLWYFVLADWDEHHRDMRTMWLLNRESCPCSGIRKSQGSLFSPQPRHLGAPGAQSARFQGRWGTVRSDPGVSALMRLFSPNQQPRSEYIVWGSKNGNTVASLNIPPNNSFTKGEKFDYRFTFSAAGWGAWDAKDTIIPPSEATLFPSLQTALGPFQVPCVPA